MGPNAGGPPIHVYVKATLDPTTHKVCFDHEWLVTGNPNSEKGEIKIANGTPSTRIFFHLRPGDDETGLGLTFCTPATEAMYVSVDPTYPSQPGGGGQITFPHKPSPHVLMVEDANSGNEVVLKYALRFNGKNNAEGDERPPYAYDPDIRNGGGGQLASSWTTGVLILGFVCGAALGSFATYFSLQS